MQILMLEHKAVMHAGRERSFSPGVCYDVSDVIGQQWCASGAASAAVAPAHPSDDLAPAAEGQAHETKKRSPKERG